MKADRPSQAAAVAVLETTRVCSQGGVHLITAPCTCKPR